MVFTYKGEDIVGTILRFARETGSDISSWANPAKTRWKNGTEQVGHGT